MIFAELDDFLFSTVQMYTPPTLPVTVNVWVYEASTALLSIVEVDSERMSESLVQET